MARNDDAEPIARAERPCGPVRVRMTGESRKPAVRDRLARRDAPNCFGHSALEVARSVEVELHVAEIALPGCEVTNKPNGERMRLAVPG